MVAATQSDIDSQFLELVEELSMRALGAERFATARLQPYGDPVEDEDGGSTKQPEPPEEEPEKKDA